MEHLLTEVLRDQRKLGSKSEGAWKRVAYNTSATKLYANFKVQVTWENVKNQVKLWRSQYGVASDILSLSEFDWDDTKYIITVGDENAWNEYVSVSSILYYYFVSVSSVLYNIYLVLLLTLFYFIFKSHKEARNFLFKEIPNQDDIVDLCAKD